VHALLFSAAVVVELFTSQGCSSCPPADAYISQLVKNGGQVIPLAFHVDYWDRLGWRDPFSSRLWTQRQMMYVHQFNLDSAFTPQFVVNGRRQTIEEASRAKPLGGVAVDAVREGTNIKATIHADAPANSDIVLAVFENGVATHIERGENAGRSTTDDAIVRKLLRVQNGTVTVPIDPSWKKVGVAVFLQDRTTLAIGAAAASSLKP
jgi:hypothetical protein